MKLHSATRASGPAAWPWAREALDGTAHPTDTAWAWIHFVKLALNGYHENGIRFFDSADGYGSHPYIAQTLKQLPREKVTILTKTDNRTAAGARADVERFRKELGVDMIDIILVHVVTEADWNVRYRGVMDVLQKPSRKASSAPTASPATPSRRCAPRPQSRGWKSTSPASTPSAAI